MGYEVSFVLNQTVSMVVPLPLSDLECTTNCQVNIMQNTLPDMPFHVSVAGENRFGIGQSTPCTGDTIGELLVMQSGKERALSYICLVGYVLYYFTPYLPACITLPITHVLY